MSLDAGVSSEPQVNLPIFSGGRNLAALDLANVRKRIEIAHYEQSIQIAFREVADALVTRSTLDDQLRAQEALTRASDSSYRLADQRYRGGVDSYLSALIARRDLYDGLRAGGGIDKSAAHEPGMIIIDICIKIWLNKANS